VLFSQTPGKIEYAPVGAKWVYEVYFRSTFTNPIEKIGFVEYLVEKDTFIQNKNCKKIIVSSFCDMTESWYRDLIPYNCGNGQSGSGYKYTLTYISNDTVYFFSHFNNTFVPIFKSGVTTGTNQVCFWGYQSNYQSVPWVYNPCSSVTPSVIGQGYAKTISNVFLFNDTLKKFDIGMLPNPPYYNHPADFVIIEKIGFLISKDGMIPFSTYHNMEQTFEIRNLKCYYDPLNGWIQFDFNRPCYYFGPVNIREYNLGNNIKYHLSNDKINIELVQNNSPFFVYLYDIHGRLSKKSEFAVKELELDCKDLSRGVYLLIIKINNQYYKTKIIL
jgi:hypothetical protein